MADSSNLHDIKDMMTRLNVDRSVLDTLEKEGLLAPAGRYDRDTPYYTDESISQGETIKSLLDLGFDFEAIRRIKTKVGLPGGSRDRATIHEKFLTIGEIAEKSGISPRTLKYWEEKELINPDGRSGGGFRLYKESFVEVCNRIKEMQLFGYTVEELKNMTLMLLPEERLRSELTTRHEEERLRALEKFATQHAALEDKIDSLKRAIKRWEKILKQQKKLIAQYKSKQAVK